MDSWGLHCTIDGESKKMYERIIMYIRKEINFTPISFPISFALPSLHHIFIQNLHTKLPSRQLPPPLPQDSISHLPPYTCPHPHRSYPTTTLAQRTGTRVPHRCFSSASASVKHMLRMLCKRYAFGWSAGGHHIISLAGRWVGDCEYLFIDRIF